MEGGSDRPVIELLASRRLLSPDGYGPDWHRCSHTRERRWKRAQNGAFHCCYPVVRSTRDWNNHYRHGGADRDVNLIRSRVQRKLAAPRALRTIAFERKGPFQS